MNERQKIATDLLRIGERYGRIDFVSTGVTEIFNADGQPSSVTYYVQAHYFESADSPERKAVLGKSEHGFEEAVDSFIQDLFDTFGVGEPDRDEDDGQPSDIQEQGDFAQDGDFENMSAADIM